MMTSIFNDANKDALEKIKELNSKKLCTFLIPTKFITAEASQLAYILNSFINVNSRAKNTRQDFKCFFSNSRFEAIHGAIKIARHHYRTMNLKKSIAPSTLIYDSTLELKYHFDPLNNGIYKAFVPGVKITNCVSDILSTWINYNILCIRLFECELTEKTIKDLIEKSSEMNNTIVLDFSGLSIRNIENILQKYQKLPDVIIFGEELTEYQIPFGVIMMSSKIYQPWESIENCFIHSSTYSGNRLAVSYAKDFLVKNSKIIKMDDINYLRNIANSFYETRKVFARYINPGLEFLYSFSGLNIDPIFANGSILEMEIEGKLEKVIDLASGAGSAVRGHTPTDTIDAISLYDNNIDYQEKLRVMLKTLTGLEECIPAVSGASAVDIAITLALTANFPKTRIITFGGNYGGKTLLSLNISTDPSIQNPFSPLYFDKVYINPFDSNAAKFLKDELQSGKVGLVWFEYVQGAECDKIPSKLIDIINAHKKQGYYIGVDEILMGCYRAGHFTSFHGKVKADIITFSKAISDGTFPYAITMLNKKLYTQAKKVNKDLIKYFTSLYKNQLGALIALNCIKCLSLNKKLQEHINKIKGIFDNGFKEIVKHSDLIESVNSYGLLYKINYSFKKTTRLFSSKIREFAIVLFLTKLSLKEAKVLLFFDRAIPALSITEEEARMAIEGLKKAMMQKTFILKVKLLQYKFFLLWYYIKKSIWQFIIGLVK